MPALLVPRSVRSSSAPLVAILWLCLAPGLAQAGTIVITFSGTVENASGVWGAVLSGGETITGTVELDDTVVGAFTPGTVFLRAEMLYTGAVTSMSLVVDGNPISGTGGDVELFDSDGPFNGDDSYEATGVLDTGTVGGVVPTSFFWNSAYDDPVFTFGAGSPLFPPPPIDPGSTNQFTLSAGASTVDRVSGRIDTFTASTPAPVPLLSPVGLGLLTGAVALLGVARARARGGSRAEG